MQTDFFFFRSRDVISKGRRVRGEDVMARDEDGLARSEDGLARGEDGLARGEDGMARGEDVMARDEDGLARSEDGLARGEDGLARGDDGLSRGEDELARAEDFRKLKDQHKGSNFLSPIKTFQYMLLSEFVTLSKAPGNQRPFFSFIHRLDMELDLQSFFVLHVHSCTQCLRPHNPPSPHLGSYTSNEGRYWSAKIDDISL
jgi:hypothetical protein